MNLAVILARGGSKRVPRKNVRPFCGRPMLAWPIAAARESGLFDAVIVSTEDDEIAAVAEAHGAEVPFRRPAELADDRTGTLPVMAHALDWFEAHRGPVDMACCIYATAAFLRPEYLRAGLERLQANPDADFAFSVTSYSHPIFRAFALEPDGRVRMFWPEHERCRSQDLPAAWHDAGQFYWGRPAAFRRSAGIFSARAFGVPIPRHAVQDIDTPEDWELAERLFALARTEREMSSPAGLRQGAAASLHLNKLVLTRKLRELYERGENLSEYLRSLSHSTSNSVEDVMLSYDFQAGSYIAAYERDAGYLESYTEALATVLGELGAVDSILEVGVGEATTFSVLATKLPHIRYWWGFDISWSRIKFGQMFAARRGPRGWQPELFCADLFHMPIAERSFDVVYTSHSLEPNGGREREAIEALARVARKWLVLLEPAYDLAPAAARARMEQHGYVRNLAENIRALGLDLVVHRMFPVSANPLNPTGLYLARVRESALQRCPAFVCPITGTPLERGPQAFYSPSAMLAYPVLDGVPCLTPANAILATKYHAP